MCHTFFCCYMDGKRAVLQGIPECRNWVRINRLYSQKASKTYTHMPYMHTHRVLNSSHLIQLITQLTLQEKLPLTLAGLQGDSLCQRPHLCCLTAIPLRYQLATSTYPRREHAYIVCSQIGCFWTNGIDWVYTEMIM